MNADEFLTQKVIGPLPMWAVIGLAGGVILLVLRPAGGDGGGGDTSPQLPNDPLGAGGDLGQGAGPVDYGAIVGPGSGSGGFEDPNPIVELPPDPTGDPNPTPYDPVTPPTRWRIDPSGPIILPGGPVPVGPTAGPDAPIYLPQLASIADSLLAKGIDPTTGAFVGGGAVSSGEGGANAAAFGGTTSPIFQGTAAVATTGGAEAGGFFHADEGLA